MCYHRLSMSTRSRSEMESIKAVFGRPVVRQTPNVSWRMLLVFIHSVSGASSLYTPR